MNKSLNKTLRQAKTNKNDEFYTQLTDIDKELKHYKHHFKDKVVYCNCDDPRVSNFFHYFSFNFEKLGLKKLITTCYKSQSVDLFSQNASDRALYLEYSGDKNGNNVPDLEEIGIHYLDGDGDFRSKESIELLKQADIVVTNPPFSLFREYVTQLIDYNKKFLIVGSQNAITYKEIFELIKDNKLWLGVDNGGTKWFKVPEHYEIKTLTRIKHQEDGKYFSMGNVVWYTNLETKKREEKIILYKEYNETEFPNYDNYDAINVDKVSEIPNNYFGIMGVPITFIDKYNPKQFQLLGIMNTGEENIGIRYENTPHGRPLVNGVEKYLRILIKRTDDN
jgi:hypothetical protein